MTDLITDAEMIGKTTQPLSAQEEWRFEVSTNSQERPLLLKVASGDCEIFGTELATGRIYTFPIGYKGAVFSWEGCQLEWCGDLISEYVSSESPMEKYLSIHMALERQRMVAKMPKEELEKAEVSIEAAVPPRVLIMGPSDSGKTALCKILCAYAVKMGEQPLFVNLDVREGAFSLPGCVSAAAISDILNVEAGWGDSDVSGPSQVNPKQPLVYHYGWDNAGKEPPSYMHAVAQLSEAVRKRLEKDKDGIIVDTPGMDKDFGVDSITKIISGFDINTVLVLGSERMYADLRKKLADVINSKQLQIVKVPKSGGVVERDDKYIRDMQAWEIKKYFYGDSTNFLSPFSVTVDYSAISLYKINETNTNMQLISSFMPGDEDYVKEEGSSLFSLDGVTRKLVKIEEPTQLELQSSVLVILNADVNDSIDEIENSSVMGFVHVIDADDTKRKLKLLMPVPGRLPTRPFVLGSFKYLE